MHVIEYSNEAKTTSNIYILYQIKTIKTSLFWMKSNNFHSEEKWKSRRHKKKQPTKERNSLYKKGLQLCKTTPIEKLQKALETEAHKKMQNRDQILTRVLHHSSKYPSIALSIATHSIAQTTVYQRKRPFIYRIEYEFKQL